MTLRLAALALFCSPAYAATIPAFVIEASPCGTVHTLHEDMTSAVVANERGSRHYVCGDGVNPFPYDALADLKGPHPEFPAHMTGVSLLPVGRSPHTAVSARVTGGASAVASGGSSSFAGASSFSSSHVHTADCPCGCCDWKPEPPTPVPLPAGFPLYAAIMGALGLWRFRG